MNASTSERELFGNGWLAELPLPIKLMLRLSSLPAQAASATGNIRIATRFADIPNCNPSFENPASGEVLDLPQMKGNPHFSVCPDGRPSAVGDATVLAGPDIRRERRGQWIKPLPSDRYQPRLAGWVTCLAAIFED